MSYETMSVDESTIGPKRRPLEDDEIEKRFEDITDKRLEADALDQIGNPDIPPTLKKKIQEEKLRQEILNADPLQKTGKAEE